MTEQKHNLYEQLDSLLSKHIEEAQPRSEWKVEFVESMESSVQKKHKKIKWRLLPLVLVLPLSAMVLAKDQLVPHTMWFLGMSPYAAAPFHIVSDWEKEHVRYEAAPGFTLPYPLTTHDIQYPAFSREALDPIIEQVNADLLSEVTVDGETISYTNGEQTFNFYNDTDDEIRFEWTLMQWPVNEKGKPKKSVVTDCVQVQPQMQAVLDAYPQLKRGYNAVLNVQQLDGLSCGVWLQVSDAIQIQAYELKYFGSDLLAVSGVVIESIRMQESEEYGTFDEILQDLHENPSFPLSGVEPNIDIVYQISDYRITGRGLEVFMRIKDIDAVYEAFGLTGDIQPPPSFAAEYSGSWRVIEPIEERRKLLRDIQQYMYENRAGE